MKFTLLAIQIILSVLLIFIILIQKNSGEGWSGIASSSATNLSKPRKSSGNFLTKATSILAFLFMANCIILGNIVIREKNKPSIFETKDGQTLGSLKKQESPEIKIAE
jgi:preprotein translocase subunit SecG